MSNSSSSASKGSPPKSADKRHHNLRKGADNEEMLIILVVLGIMFLGICIAMNLFSRARFKKQRNAFTAAAGRNSACRRSYPRAPGLSQRSSTSHCPSPIPSQLIQQHQHHQQTAPSHQQQTSSKQSRKNHNQSPATYQQQRSSIGHISGGCSSL